jgi:hypothetical protein
MHHSAEFFPQREKHVKIPLFLAAFIPYQPLKHGSKIKLKIGDFRSQISPRIRNYRYIRNRFSPLIGGPRGIA